MAIQSRVQWENGHPEANATVTIFWDDVSLLLTSIVINNTNGPNPIPCKATVNANGRTFETTVVPGATFQQDIPTGQANRMQLSINPDNGRLDGVSWQIG